MGENSETRFNDTHPVFLAYGFSFACFDLFTRFCWELRNGTKRNWKKNLSLIKCTILWQWTCVKYLFKGEPLGGALRDLPESLLVTTSSVYLLWVVESDSCYPINNNKIVNIFDCALQYRVFSHDVTAAILVSQNNETAATLVSQTSPLGVEIFSYANAFFCSNKFAHMLAHVSENTL